MIKKLPFWILCTIGVAGFSQDIKRIELVNAEVLEYDESKGDKIKRLKGDVVFKHDGLTMYCDSAYLSSATNTLDAFSNVRIMQGDSLQIDGDYLNYKGNTKRSELINNIRLKHLDMVLTTNHLIHDMNTGIATYFNGGEITDADNRLTSKTGNYNSSNYTLFFKDSVYLENPEYTMKSDTLNYNTKTKTAYFQGPTSIISNQNKIYCKNGWYDTPDNSSMFSDQATIFTGKNSITADSMYYYRNQGHGIAYGNVIMHDSIEGVIISGGFADYYELEDRALVTKNAMLTDIYAEDSLFLHADTFKTSLDSTGHKLILAYHKVRFYKTNLQGVCDSISYSFKDSTIHLFNNPFLWSEANQMKADFIRIYSGEKGIELLEFNQNAFISSRVDSGLYNQIKGKDMWGYFLNNDLKKIKVLGNGQTIYYPKNNNESIIGVNTADCSDMWIYVNENNIEKISFLTQPAATLYPLNEIAKEELILQGFKWNGYQRPLNRHDIFIWR